MLRKTQNLSRRIKVDVKLNSKHVKSEHSQNDDKKQESAPKSLETYVSTVNNPLNVDTICESTDQDSIYPDIDSLTNEDIDDLINDVNSFINDGIFDVIMSDGDLTSSSSLNLPITPVSDVIDLINISASEENFGALDISINKDVLQIPQSESSATSKVKNSKNSPMKNVSVPVTKSLLTPNTEPNNFKQHECEIPMDHLPIRAQVAPENRLVDEKYSTKIESTETSYLKKTIQKQKTLQETEMSYMKSVLILEEILGLQGIKPIYDLLISQATDISQIFKYRVWFNDYDANGVGKSLEDAQNSAARALLDKLASKNYFGNQIGALQELCMARNWPLPVYGDEMEIHSRDGHDFIITCKVLKYIEIGQSSKKKNAKLFAAYKMWNYLKSIN